MDSLFPFFLLDKIPRSSLVPNQGEIVETDHLIRLVQLHFTALKSCGPFEFILYETCHLT